MRASSKHVVLSPEIYSKLNIEILHTHVSITIPSPCGHYHFYPEMSFSLGMNYPYLYQLISINVTPSSMITYSSTIYMNKDRIHKYKRLYFPPKYLSGYHDGRSQTNFLRNSI